MPRAAVHGFYMRGIINRILAAEEEGRRLAAEARERAAAIVAGAKKEARELTALSSEKARLAAELAGAAELAAAERERSVSLEAARAGIESRLRLDGPARRRAADAVIRKVLGKD